MESPEQYNPATSPLPANSEVHKDKKALFIGVILIIIVGGVLWYTLRKDPPKEPLEVLQALEETSEPVSASSESRAGELEGLEKSSKPVTKTDEERLQELEKLSQ